MSRNQGSGVRSQESGVTKQQPGALTPESCLLTPEIELERYELAEGPRYLFEPDRRDFFKLTGAGIAVFLVAAEALGQPRRPGGGAGRPQELGAWLHVGEDGKVTAFTGKVEVGQNIRTSLSQVIAEELHVPMASISLVMADTDRTPYDMGTFGSRTTPDMAQQLRRAAAAAREWLLELAAARAKDRNGRTLLAEKGRVRLGGTDQSWTFAELVKGQKAIRTVAADTPLTPPRIWSVISTSAPKVDARAMVTGKHQFTSDIKRPGMLYGKVLRPEVLGATLAAVDLKPAQAMPGVSAVRDGDFVGIAAPSANAAEEALAAIRAEWKKPEAPVTEKDLFERLKKDSGGGGGGRGGGGAQGSIERGLAAADQKLAATYTIAYIAHVPLEPRAAVAEWEGGKLTVWTGTQVPFRVKSDLARAFNLAQDKVRVIVPDTGSGYGGKHTGEAALEAARLAKAAGKPVKLVWTREEEFTWAYFRPAGVIEVNAGVTKDGKITAWEFHNYNSGASSIRPLYDIPNLKTEFHGSRTPLRQGSYRALAATANHFARESHLDDLARAIRMDALEFRLKNLKDTRLRGVLEAAAKKFGWAKEKSTPQRGFGLAGGFEKGSYVATCAEVAIDKSEVRVVRAVTAFDCGAVLNPEHLKNQIEGAVIMGIGGALFEAIHFDGGRITNANLTKYRVPRFGDTPKLETVLVGRPEQPSAGAGETPIVAIAPAIGNALAAATGQRLRALPMAPEMAKSE